MTIKRVFHFILSHSIFIAICAAALSLQTLQLLSLPVNGFLLAFIFFATLCGYNAYWVVSRFSFNRPGSIIAFLQKSRSSFLVMLSAIAGMIFCMAKLHLVMYNIIITFVLLGLYSVPVMPFKQLHFTRRAGVVKTILLSFTWAFVTILIPLQIPVFQMSNAGVLLFINRFLFMLMLCIIFDKRDAAVDKIRGLHSLATAIKPRSLHYFMALILLCYIWATLKMAFYQVGAWHVVALIIAGLITQWIYVLSLHKRGYLFYYFVVDGLMFLSAMFTGIVAVLK